MENTTKYTGITSEALRAELNLHVGYLGAVQDTTQYRFDFDKLRLIFGDCITAVELTEKPSELTEKPSEFLGKTLKYFQLVLRASYQTNLPIHPNLIPLVSILKQCDDEYKIKGLVEHFYDIFFQCQQLAKDTK